MYKATAGAGASVGGLRLCLFGRCCFGSGGGFFGHGCCLCGGVGLFLGLHRLSSRGLLCLGSFGCGSLGRGLLGQLLDFFQLGDFLSLFGLGGLFLAGLADAGEALGLPPPATRGATARPRWALAGGRPVSGATASLRGAWISFRGSTTFFWISSEAAPVYFFSSRSILPSFFA